jgi:hypothetical protein
MHTPLKYEFTWKLLGDISEGRPNLGNSSRVEVYRLMQFTLKDIIEKSYGTQEADRIFYEAGRLAGTELYRHNLSGITSQAYLSSACSSKPSRMAVCRQTSSRTSPFTAQHVPAPAAHGSIFSIASLP